MYRTLLSIVAVLNATLSALHSLAASAAHASYRAETQAVKAARKKAKAILQHHTEASIVAASLAHAASERLKAERTKFLAELDRLQAAHPTAYEDAIA